MGAQMVKEVAAKTGDDAGDGTTTATVLAQKILHEGLKLVAARHNPIALKRGIDAAVEAVTKAVAKLAKPLKTHAGDRAGRHDQRERRHDGSAR